MRGRGHWRCVGRLATHVRFGAIVRMATGLAGAPGAGKGTNSRHIMTLRGLTGMAWRNRGRLAPWFAAVVALTWDSCRMCVVCTSSPD